LRKAAARESEARRALRDLLSERARRT
jgi:hypothetical protein